MAKQNNAINSNTISNNMNRNVFIILGSVLLIGLLLFSSVGNAGALSAFNKASQVPDNSDTKTELGESYEEKDASLNDVINEEVASNTTLNEETQEYVIEDSNINITIPVSELQTYIPFDVNTQDLIKVWVNPTYDVNGFNYDFEAFLVEDNSRIGFTTYSFLYRVGTEKFTIEELELKDLADAKSNSYAVLNNNLNIAQVYAKGDISDEKTTTSYLAISDSNELYLLKSREKKTNGFNHDIRGFTYLTRDSFNAGSNYYSCGQTACQNGQVFTYETYSIDELDTYSYDSVAVLSDTRTVNFDTITLVKQELNTGQNSFPERNFKFIEQEDINSIIEQGTSQLTPFLKDRVNENLPSSFDTDILVNGEAYTLGEDLGGIVVDGGYVQQTDLLGGSVISVTQAQFDDLTSYGLRFSDLGESTLQGQGIRATTFGVLYNDFEIQTHGEANLVDISNWDRSLGVIINLFTFDFSGVSQFWNQQVNSPILKDDPSVGTIGGSYPFTQTIRNANTDILGLTSSKPVEDILTYNGDTYWLFYTLENTNSQKGCMVFDKLNPILNERIPVSMCNDIVSGTNKALQFKIANGEDIE